MSETEVMDLDYLKQRVQALMELGEKKKPGSTKEFMEKNPNCFNEDFYKALHTVLMHEPIKPDFDPDAKTIGGEAILRPRSKREMNELVDIYGDNALIMPYDINEPMLMIIGINEGEADIVHIVRADCEIHMNSKTRKVKLYLRKECPNEDIIKAFCEFTHSESRYIDTKDVWKRYIIDSKTDLFQPIIDFMKLHLTVEQQKKLLADLMFSMQKLNEE